MKDTIIKSLKDGLLGKGTHIDPNTALKGLTASIARQKPSDDTHSCWELLHHMVIWQEAMLDAIKGKSVNWSEISEKENWPTKQRMENDSNFPNLVKKFELGIEEAIQLTENVNLDDLMASWGNKPILSGFRVLAQHNTYHLGELVTTRKVIKSPPPKDQWAKK